MLLNQQDDVIFDGTELRSVILSAYGLMVAGAVCETECDVPVLTPDTRGEYTDLLFYVQR